VERASVMLLWVAFLLYAAAFAVFLFHLFSQRERMNRRGLLIVAAGWAAQTASLVLRSVHAGHAPVVGAYESMALAAWAMVSVYLMLEWRTGIRAIGLYVTPVACIFLGIAWFKYHAPTALVPVLKSDVVVLHVTVILISVACFFVAGGAALIYLIEERELKRRHTRPVFGRLPSLATLERLVYHAILFGLPFLTMGIVAGVIRAEHWGVKHWYADLTPILAVIVWGLYTTFVYGHMRAGWRGRRAAYFALVGLALLLIIRFVAEPYFSNFHTYGG
jgi:ABC-type transport system involved in cytochrome c biogenesis permease subunit